jgi:DNA-binding MarR family transcriptional regulator
MRQGTLGAMTATHGPRARSVAEADAVPAYADDAGPLSLFTHLARTALFLETLQTECLAPHGLGFTDYAVLRVLHAEPSPHRLSPSRLADAVLCTSGGMTKIVDRLERAGMVVRETDPTDRRGVLVRLTRVGARTSTAASAAYADGRLRVLGRLGAREAAAIDRSLRQLLAAFEADRKDRS